MHAGGRTLAWLLSLSAAASGLAACAATGGRSADRSAPARPEACFDAATAESFSPLTESAVYLRTLGDRHYLLTLDGFYTGLPFAAGITIANGFRTVCSGTRATLEFTSFGRPVRCRIVTVDAVASQDAARRLAQERSGRR